MGACLRRRSACSTMPLPMIGRLAPVAEMHQVEALKTFRQLFESENLAADSARPGWLHWPWFDLQW